MIPILHIMYESFILLISVVASHEASHEWGHGRVIGGRGAFRERLNEVECRKAGFKEQLELSGFLKNETGNGEHTSWFCLCVSPLCVIALKSDQP